MGTLPRTETIRAPTHDGKYASGYPGTTTNLQPMPRSCLMYPPLRGTSCSPDRHNRCQAHRWAVEVAKMQPPRLPKPDMEPNRGVRFPRTGTRGRTIPHGSVGSKVGPPRPSMLRIGSRGSMITDPATDGTKGNRSPGGRYSIGKRRGPAHFSGLRCGLQ